MAILGRTVNSGRIVTLWSQPFVYSKYNYMSCKHIIRVYQVDPNIVVALTVQFVHVTCGSPMSNIIPHFNIIVF